jgi:hypothetical protein
MSRGKSQRSLELVEAAREILAEIEPATVRAVCYRLFVAGIIPSMVKANTNRVSRQLVWAREEGLIPWEWIVDETREAESIPSWSSPDALIRSAVTQYRRDNWLEQPCRVEVWSEKGTVRGTLAPVLDRYGVTFRVMHGYGSATAIQSIAQESAESDRVTHALYVGDWDPSGLHMSEVDLPERIARYGGKVRLSRVALQADETGSFDLPSFAADAKRNDPRYRWYVARYGARCWELDAMPPPELRADVEAMIIDLLDRDTWEHSLMVERAEVESLQGVMDAWRASKSRQASVCDQVGK